MEIKFKSVFKKDINNMLLYEQAMNFKYSDKLNLYDLDNYFISINKKTKDINEEDYYNYIYNYNNSNINNYQRYLIIIKFCKYLIRFGNTNIFFEEIKFKDNVLYQPHIYSKEEIEKIFNLIDNKKYKNTRFNFEYPVLFRLLYSTGLRISEALNIKFNDVDLSDNSINILLSKENISRKIYFSNTMKKVLNKYFKLIDFKNNDYLFTTTKENSQLTFRNIVNELNIKTISIRQHDLRHTFAVESFNKLIKMDIEPEEALLYLEKYLGHSNISSTEYYLHMTNNMKKEIIKTMKNYKPDLYPKVKGGINE